MKKLMILGAVAMLAVAANASACIWKATTGYLPGADLDDGPFAADLTLLCFDSANDLSYASAQEYLNQKNIAALTAASAQTKKSTTSTTGDEGNFNFVGPDRYDSSQAVTVEGYAIIIDSANNMAYLTDELSGTTTALGSNATLNFRDIEGMAETGFVTAGEGWYNLAGTDVPEPTSGLMLLLGVAGLALRRRRA